MVKPEIFGSRRSELKNLLEKVKKAKPNIEIFDNIWFGTCLFKYNSDPKSRYIIFYECFNDNEFKFKDFTNIKKFFKTYIPFFKIMIQKNSINFIDINNQNYFNFKYPLESKKAAKFVLEKVKCDKDVTDDIKTATKDNAPELSKFFRKDCFGRLAMTDIDFVVVRKDINSAIFIEEKLYTENIENNNFGSIGLGQLLSLKEIINDVIDTNKNFDFYILFYNQKKEEWFKWDLKINKEKKYKSYYDEKYKEIRIIIHDLEKVEIFNLFLK